MTVCLRYETISRKMPILTKCCFCFPLHTGCFVLGYINVAFNSIHSIFLLALTVILGVSTHGFDHFDYGGGDDPVLSEKLDDVKDLERPAIQRVALFLCLMLLANLSWLTVNVACLYGLHKKRPGPILVYVVFASLRILASIAGSLYFIITSDGLQPVHNAAMYVVDIVLSSYFIFIYFIYASQIEYERKQNIMNEQTPNNKVCEGEIAFVYKSNIEKDVLVS